MGFAERYTPRFKQVIEPAIGEVGLEAYRVDNSKTGDCIVTDISDGIAHSQLVLADVSTTPSRIHGSSPKASSRCEARRWTTSQDSVLRRSASSFAKQCSPS
jgi:hypothetical protein